MENGDVMREKDRMRDWLIKSDRKIRNDYLLRRLEWTKYLDKFIKRFNVSEDEEKEIKVSISSVS